MYFFRNNDDYPEKVSPTAILLAINQQEVRPLPLSVSCCNSCYGQYRSLLPWMVDEGIRTIRPDICIIDGIKDLMTDINDAVQATLIMEKLMALAKELNCCIVCVLHQNKSEQDRNMRGSIGTELTNKAFEVFQCETIDGTSQNRCHLG